MGCLVFIFILLLFQILRLTEFILIHGVGIETVLSLLYQLTISFLPAVLPMSLLFSVLLTYMRMAQDSEITALRALGYSRPELAFPAVTFALLISLFAFHTSSQLAPKGNRQFEVLINDLGQQKASAAIKSGTFSEGFFNLTVYAHQVDAVTNTMSNLFIYDERNNQSPLTIVARRGKIIQQSTQSLNQAFIRLTEGKVFRNDSTQTVVDFGTYDIHLSNSVTIKSRDKSLQSMTLGEVDENYQRKKVELSKHKNPPDNLKRDALKLQTEWHKRFAVSGACFVFGLIGVAFGLGAGGRNQKASGFVLSIVLLVIFWILYLTFESLAHSGVLPPVLAIWATNVAFGSFGIYQILRS